MVMYNTVTDHYKVNLSVLHSNNITVCHKGGLFRSIRGECPICWYGEATLEHDTSLVRELNHRPNILLIAK